MDIVPVIRVSLDNQLTKEVTNLVIILSGIISRITVEEEEALDRFLSLLLEIRKDIKLIISHRHHFRNSHNHLQIFLIINIMRIKTVEISIIDLQEVVEEATAVEEEVAMIPVVIVILVVDLVEEITIRDPAEVVIIKEVDQLKHAPGIWLSRKILYSSRE